jgi:O-antigen ligase
VSLALAAHWWPLLLLLGGLQFGVVGKSFYFPFYAAPVLFLVLRQGLRFSPRRIARLDLWVAAYCAGGLASFFFATDLPKYAYGAFTLFLVWIPAYALGRRLGSASSWSPRTFLNALVALGAGISLLYLLRLATYPGGWYSAFLLKLPSVGGMHSNTLVSLHVFGLVATIECLRRAQGWGKRGWLVGLLVVELAAGLAFNSRAYLLLMFLPVVFYLLTGKDRGAWLLRFGLAAALLVVVASPPRFLLSTLSFRWTAQAARERSWRDSPRVQIWLRSLGVWSERPLFGHGLGNSFLGADFLWRLLYSQFTAREIAEAPPEALAVIRPDGYFMAHNTILQLLLEVGLFGAFVFLVVFGRFLGSLWELRSSANAEGRALASVLLFATLITFLDGMVENNFLTRDFGAFYWFLVGVTYSARRACPAGGATTQDPSSGARGRVGPSG